MADITVIDNADDSYARLNGQSAVVLSVFKSSTAGTNEVSKNIAAAISELEEQYPGLSVLTLMDQGDYITMIINGVLQSMIVGAALAILILALFLKRCKTHHRCSCQHSPVCSDGIDINVFYRYFTEHDVVIGSGTRNRYAGG